jgi:hypothetical protein
MMRVMLYEAAHIMLVRLAKWSLLKAWAMKIARHRGMKKAIVALARRGRDTASGLTAPSSGGPGRLRQRENPTESSAIEESPDPPSSGKMSLAGRWMR